MKNYKNIILSIIFLGLFSCTPIKKEQKQSITVFSGAGLTDVLTEIVDSFEVKNHIKVKTNLASSGTLARQIEQGEVPDVYISASKKWADYIDSLGFTLANYKQGVAINNMVLIAPKNSTLNIAAIDSSLDIASILKDERLSMGDPAHVPAGKYAKQALEYYGWYKPLKDRILPAKDVRSALMVVELGETPLGIVYKTDALKSEKVRILTTFPSKSHIPISFIASVLKDNKLAKDFYTFLSAEEMKSVWEKHGFITKR
ncbi:molybdate ABC transporter substrate-binding protein [Plebeiibacterium marinum]|uniref:Molybdate ABC transporter substrate-binding protein n=1 Tax=Plebeiibacterium marinum TaxID=2992111 RepID=A0AAE3SM07_9BACT|nr:molybdate ABC transporter substrate-binding protein [Plebeiobacterium marinum]MCW3807984.1 molybdate ABC transporter substrate-binding protein [Plebeiobacterium marinum]